MEGKSVKTNSICSSVRCIRRCRPWGPRSPNRRTGRTVRTYVFRRILGATFDDFTNMYYNVCILTEDVTRPELFSCTCSTNAKELTCVHSLGLAMMRGTLNAQVQLLGRKRKRGRRPLAPPAWEMLHFAINSPLQHPQQDPVLLLGAQPVPNPVEGIARLQAGLNLVEALQNE